MCKSVRGAAFFGSSLHLAFSFVFLIWFLFDTIISEINLNLYHCVKEQKFSEIDPLAHYLNLLFKLLYFTGLCVTGVYMFRGVEREKPRLLKFATLGFIILQIVGLILFSVFFSIQWNTEPEADALLPEPARLTGVDEVAGVPESPKITQAPIISENVIAAPDINGTLTTTTTPIPALAEPELPVVVTNATTTSTTTPAPPLPLPPVARPKTKSKLPHNQLVMD
ncbi:hypothetical protein Ocin01_06039, partial [Orchesella cincta]